MPFDVVTDPNNVSAIAFTGAPTPPDVANLRADAVLGDGNYTNPPFGPWQYALTGDGTQVFYDAGWAMWVTGAAPPAGPYSGEVVADLATLRNMLGAASTVDDDNLARALATATEYVYERCMRCDWDHPDVQYAILLLAARYYQRRKSPEGVAGFSSEGFVVRVAATDPDINRLMERHLEMANVGIG